MINMLVMLITIQKQLKSTRVNKSKIPANPSYPTENLSKQFFLSYST